MRMVLPLFCLMPCLAALEVSEAQFADADRNHDGVVLPDELPRPAIFKRLDHDGDGRITRSEAGLPPQPLSSTMRVPPTRIPPGEAPLIGQQIPNLSGLDVEEATLTLDQVLGNHPAIVIVLRDPDCPVGAKLRGDLIASEARWKTLGVPLLRIGYSDENDALKRDSIGFSGPLIVDRDQQWTTALAAQRTTEVFVVDRSRTLRYRGALSDRVGIGYELESARALYADDAVTAVLAGHQVIIPATSAPGCAIHVPTPIPGTDTPTWNGAVSRIFQQRCDGCHHEDGIGPFSLETHAQVSGRRLAMVREVIDERRMPPWFADASTGHWANDAGLSANERTTILAWIDGGCPIGDAAQAPQLLVHDDTWAIGTPDLVLEIPQAQAIPAQGTIPYRWATITNPLDHDVWIQAYEIRPSAPQVVHHVLAFLNGAEEEQGGGVRGFFAGMVPGQNAVIWQPGLAKLLPAHATLRLQIHYTTNGQAASDRTRIAFRFATSEPDRPIFTHSAATVKFEIPPGDNNYEVVAEHRFQRDTVILAFMPHMHVRGKSFRYELMLPGGKTETLLDIPAYDFNWQLRYDAAEPISVPKGARLRGIAHFDNSASNPANPDPTATVHHGEQTWDEMMIGYFEGYEP